MALKNDESISDLGRRLFALMDEKQIESPKELATLLYDAALVHVKTRENFNSPSRDRDNAILSVEKKIVRHIKSGLISDSQGEYILAYSKFFHCSSDYILGLTDIRSSNIEVRFMCEKLGLSEKVVVSLIHSRKNQDDLCASCWSLLMESSLFSSVPQDIVSMGKELQQQYQHEGKIKALRWEREKNVGPDLMDINLDIKGQEQQMDSSRSAFYGLLSKTSRNFSEIIEQHLISVYEPFRIMFAKKILEETKKKYEKASHD